MNNWPYESGAFLLKWYDCTMSERSDWEIFLFLPFIVELGSPRMIWRRKEHGRCSPNSLIADINPPKTT